MPTITLDSTIARSPDQVSTDLGDEVVILGLPAEEYYALEAVGAHIWRQIAQPQTARAVLDSILRRYAVEPGRGQADLLAVLGELAGEGLIEVT
jgi:hypothetical protein